jgi:ABC-type nitrate/sulfonate/bicarbonate transport system permease component
MLRYQAQFRFDKLFAVIAAILVGAALLLSLLKRLENRLLRWKFEGSMGTKGEV